MRKQASDTGVTTRIRFQTARGSFDAVLHDNAIAKAVARQLPVSSNVNRWGDEIYFDVPVKMPNVSPTVEVGVGDIAYWPDGPCLCIFFGKTPSSKANEPRPASDVTIVGHTDAPPELLRLVEEGQVIEVARAERNQGSATRLPKRRSGAPPVSDTR